MKRIEHATALVGANGSGKNGFFEGEKSTQRAATVVTAKWLNDVQEEIANAITSAGLALSDSRTQLADAIAIAATGSSSANAISIRGVGVSSAAPAVDDLLIKTLSSWTPGKIRDASIDPSAAIAPSKLSNFGATGNGGNYLTTLSGVPAWSSLLAWATISGIATSLGNGAGAGVEAAPIVVCQGSSQTAIHGMKHASGVTPEFRILCSWNSHITIPWNSSSAAIGERFYNATNSDLSIEAGQFVMFVYSSGWYPLVSL